jgi:hypothetical protein
MQFVNHSQFYALLNILFHFPVYVYLLFNASLKNMFWYVAHLTLIIDY